MGYDDHGLPTDRLAEHALSDQTVNVSGGIFVQKCDESSEAVEAQRQKIWNGPGLSVDRSHSHLGIDRRNQRIFQRMHIGVADLTFYATRRRLNIDADSQSLL